MNKAFYFSIAIFLAVNLSAHFSLAQEKCPTSVCLNLQVAAESQERTRENQPRRRKLSIAPEEFYNAGIKLAAAHRFSEAVEAFKSALKLEPDWAEAHNKLGAAYYNLNLYEEAAKSFARAVQLRPDSAEAYYNLGAAYDEAGQLEEAVEAFNHAIRLKQDYAEAYDKLGEAYYKTGEFDKALEPLQKGVELQPNEAWSRYTLGLLYIGMGNGEGALKQYNALHSLDEKLSDELFKHLVKTSAYAEMDSSVAPSSIEATAQEERLTPKPPVDSPELNNSGEGDAVTKTTTSNFPIRRGNSMQTDAPLSDMRKEKTDAQADFAAGRAFVVSKQYREAVAAYKSVISADPGNVAAYYELGVAYEAANQNEAAVNAYGQVIERQPKNFCALKNLGWTYMRMQRWQEASATYRQALQLRSNVEEASYNRCEAYFDSAAPRYNLGVAYLELHQYKSAAEAFKDALRRDPKDAASHYGLADAQLALGDKKTANEEYQLLLTLDKELATKLFKKLHNKQSN